MKNYAVKIVDVTRSGEDGYVISCDDYVATINCDNDIVNKGTITPDVATNFFEEPDEQYVFDFYNDDIDILVSAHFDVPSGMLIIDDTDDNAIISLENYVDNTVGYDNDYGYDDGDYDREYYDEYELQKLADKFADEM